MYSVQVVLSALWLNVKVVHDNDVCRVIIVTTLYLGHPNLCKVMGCEELGAQVAALGSTVHIFGHSHMNVDQTINGTRFLQVALGYPNERWGSEPSPRLVWPPREGRGGGGGGGGGDDGCSMW
jgi:hypothetical protein